MIPVGLQKVGRNAEEIVVGVAMTVMCVMTLANVVSRYFFGITISWAAELARYSFIWLAFAGAALCAKHKADIAIDALVAVLPEYGKAVMRLVSDIAVGGLMLVMIYYGWRLTAAAHQPTSALGVPTYVVYAVVPISALMILVRTLAELRRDLLSLFRRESG